MNVSKPPKFDGKRGLAYVIKFRSWTGVKGISRALIPSFDSTLPNSKESNTLDDTDLIQKVQGIARKQNAVAMDATVQSMNDTDNFHCILQSMNKMWVGLVERLGRPGKSSRNITNLKTVPLQGT